MGLMERIRRSGANWSRTIVAFNPIHAMRKQGRDGGDRLITRIERTPEDEFKIRIAYNDERHREASFLVKRRYSEAGYVVHGQSQATAGRGCPEEITLLSYRQSDVVGTLTVGLDVGQGLLADELYRDELDRLRAQGCKIAEFTKLAIDSKGTSVQVLASMFHIAYIHLRRIWRYSDMVIEVNPGHVDFYRKMMGFEELGPQRLCPRVNAPAVLLRLESDHVDRMLEQFGGKPELARKMRSLYPYCFSPNKDREITRKLVQNEEACA